MKVPDNPPLPAKLESEGEVHYQLLCLYCLMGTRRSLEKVAEIYYKNLTETDQNLPEKLTIGNLKNISRENHWVVRAKEYDILSLRFYQQHLLANLQERQQEWVERTSKIEEAQNKLLEEVCAQVDEYSLLSEARKHWLKKHRTKLKTSPQLMQVALSLEKDGLEMVEKVMKVSDKLWDKQEVIKMEKILDSLSINYDFIYGDEMNQEQFSVETLKNGDNFKI